ncbi:[protein-PII] uridylyltransferase [Desulfococcaceae bacterium OttesenSCG-928-F15]|nr:[protein-PII] uridylyltransferase [Desulfococcaceae bacterium OttesenSCG-928-F15]
MAASPTSAVRELKEARAILFEAYRAGRAPDFLHQHAALLDSYFREGFSASEVGPGMGLAKNPYAIIALGGYGRMEQCIHSDVDLLFLFEREVPEGAEALVREMVYPLWDIGLEVGYATRSVSECIAVARENLEVLTSMLDARFICGLSPLYMTLMDEMRAHFVASHPKKIMEQLVEGSRKRHEQYGDSTHLLEPNLKQGQGGLRDYHTMLWLGHVKFGLKEPRDLEYNGYLSWEEFDKLQESLNFIWKVRNELHYSQGRKCDQLYFEYQIPLAGRLGFTDSEERTAVENFLGVLHLKMDFVKQLFLMLLDEMGQKQKFGFKRRYQKATRIRGLHVDEGMLYFDDVESVLKNPDLLLLVFLESGIKKLPLSAEAKRIVHEMAHLVDENYLGCKAARKIFEKILAIPPFTYHPLDEMQASGLLSRLIPEFATIISRIQYNEYHLYPVAKHSLRTVQTLSGFAAVPDLKDSLERRIYHDAFREIRSKIPLFWGALLHDIGKGFSSEDHSLVGAEKTREILGRFGIRKDWVETVVFLVEEHLFLIKTATRRDTNDEETIVAVALKIGDATRLRMLFLLTVADSISTGPKAWNDWTASLLTGLYIRTLKMLETGELSSANAASEVEAKKEAVLGSAAGKERQEMEKLLSGMPPSYLLELSVPEIRTHMRLRMERNEAPFAWEVVPSMDETLRRVLVVADDKPGFFFKAAGAFAKNGLDILDARIYGWRDRSAANLFILKAPKDLIFEEEIWEKTKADLEDLVTGKLDPAVISAKTPLFPKRKGLEARPSEVRIDNASSSFYTIVEVYTYDFPGLLFRLTRALFDCLLDVKSAKIATKVDQVVDVFYVRGLDGEKIDSPEDEERIRQAVFGVLPDCEAKNP